MSTMRVFAAGLGLGNGRAARKAAARFLTHLGADPKAAPVSAILDAQAAVARASEGRLGLNLTTGVTPIPGVGPLPDEAHWRDELDVGAPGLDVIVGTTAREVAAFYATNPTLLRIRRIPILGPAVAHALERAVGHLAFSGPTRRLALRLSRSGARVWTYRFAYAAPAPAFGATHCIELPFLFGADSDWTAAPMLAGADPRDINTLGRETRSAWLTFIRTGVPGSGWPPFTPDAPAVRHFGG
jgi:para-nitrobenzyl esterase